MTTLADIAAASTPRLEVLAVPGIPEVRRADDLALILGDAMAAAGIAPLDGDVVVVAQKIVSKSEGRLVSLDDVTPSPRAIALGGEVDKDPRLVEVILSESEEVVASRPGVLVVAHRSGHVMANAGVDRSNLGADAGEEHVLLLPVDPDQSAAALARALGERTGAKLAVIVSDSVGRPWRVGTAAIALGAAGLPSLVDLRGASDRDGRELRVSLVGLADQIAAAAALAMGEAAEGLPAALVRGVRWCAPDAPARALVRDKAEDLFR